MFGDQFYIAGPPKIGNIHIKVFFLNFFEGVPIGLRGVLSAISYCPHAVTVREQPITVRRRPLSVTVRGCRAD